MNLGASQKGSIIPVSLGTSPASFTALEEGLLVLSAGAAAATIQRGGAPSFSFPTGSTQFFLCAADQLTLTWATAVVPNAWWMPL